MQPLPLPLVFCLWAWRAYSGRYNSFCTFSSLPDQLVVARHDLMPGQTVQPEDLVSIEPWLPLDDRALTSADQAVGRVPVERILAGELLREERLADPEAGVGLNAVLPRGTVAVRVPLGASLAEPGDYVDLLIT